MLLERLILKQAENKLWPYRLRAGTFKEARTIDYKFYLPRIEELYAKADYWHGTGRYHYSYQGESRYDSVSVDGLIDVLDSIIQHDGLTPHQDPWIDSGGKTVSLGTVRMHSRLFALLHLYEYDTLLFELGNVRYWVRLYMNLLFLWLITNLSSCRQFLKSLFRRTSYRDFQTWASAIRKPHGTKVISIWEVASAKTVSSDIERNYPILIGISKSSLEVINTIPLTHHVEVRSLRPVMLKDFTHVEVPFERIKETEELLKSKGVFVPVLPMEFVDVYLANLPLMKLAYGN